MTKQVLRNNNKLTHLFHLIIIMSSSNHSNNRSMNCATTSVSDTSLVWKARCPLTWWSTRGIPKETSETTTTTPLPMEVEDQQVLEDLVVGPLMEVVFIGGLQTWIVTIIQTQHLLLTITPHTTRMDTDCMIMMSGLLPVLLVLQDPFLNSHLPNSRLTTTRKQVSPLGFLCRWVSGVLFYLLFRFCRLCIRTRLSHSLAIN